MFYTKCIAKTKHNSILISHFYHYLNKVDYAQEAIDQHKKYRWKLTTLPKVPLETKDDLATYYTPWVAAPCLEIAQNKDLAYDYTWKNNSVAVVSDGSAVLGLGNIGPEAWLPVMEWKAILFKKYGNIDAIPIVLNTQDPDEIIKVVEAIAPTFGWINLEDIAAPNCFYIEEELKKRLNIPVFHDDQHGTAVVVLAWLINALKLKNSDFSSQKIVISGAWAAAIAIGKLLKKAWAENIIFLDSKWVIHEWRSDLNKYKQEVSSWNKDQISWTLDDAIKWADIFIWVSKPGLLHKWHIQSMNPDPIIFALANPTPEIMPNEAREAGAFIIATWRSDFPNQVNNVLAFPGIFRGALDGRISQITDEHKIAAAKALANFVKNPDRKHIIPSAFDEWIADVVAEAVKRINL